MSAEKSNIFFTEFKLFLLNKATVKVSCIYTTTHEQPTSFYKNRIARKEKGSLNYVT